MAKQLCLIEVSAGLMARSGPKLAGGMPDAGFGPEGIRLFLGYACILCPEHKRGWPNNLLWNIRSSKSATNC